MASITYTGSTRSQPPGEPGVFNGLSAAQISFLYSRSGATETYLGVFDYSGSTLLGGTITGLQAGNAGQPVMTVTGLNVSATPVAAAVLTGNTDALFSLMTSGDDTILGSRNGELIAGGAGNDTIIALDGGDTVLGGTGDDDLNGNVGYDVVKGEGGSDWICGGKGDDTLLGGDGADRLLNGNLGNDLVNGDGGADTLYGGQNADTLSGGDGDDQLSGDLGDDLLLGGAGADRFLLRAGDGVNFIGDFDAAEGDRIQMATGARYQISLVDGHVAYDMADGSRTVLVGVTDLSQAAGWIIAV